jgi:hypothetical protein
VALGRGDGRAKRAINRPALRASGLRGRSPTAWVSGGRQPGQQLDSDGRRAAQPAGGRDDGDARAIARAERNGHGGSRRKTEGCEGRTGTQREGSLRLAVKRVTTRAHRALLDRLEATVDWYEMQGYAPQDVGGGRAVSGASVDRPYGLTVGVTFTFHGPDGDRVAEGALGNGYSIAGDALTDLRDVVLAWRLFNATYAGETPEQALPEDDPDAVTGRSSTRSSRSSWVRCSSGSSRSRRSPRTSGSSTARRSRRKGRRASRPDALYSTGTPARRGALA